MTPARTGDSASKGDPSSRHRRVLAAILLLSFLLRVVLAERGGQQFWPDEARYGDAVGAYRDLLHGEAQRGLEVLFGRSDHMLFRFAVLPAAAIEILFSPGPAFAACYLGLFSVASIYLLWAIARRAGAGPDEALWAAFYGATANTLFYYSRHYFPYDISLCALLGALWFALGPAGLKSSLMAGILAGTGFLAYNGYWLLGGCILALHVVLGAGGGRKFPWRAAGAGIGLGAPIAAMYLASRALGLDLLNSFRGYAGNVTQGDFGIAYRLIPEFLWRAEGPLPVLWLAAGGLGAVAAWRGRKPGRRILWWLGGAALVAVGLVAFSDVIPKFVVHGRLTREVVPFLCLAAASGTAAFCASRPRWAAPTLAAAIGLVAAWNFGGPFGQTFPPEFIALAEARLDRPHDAFNGYTMLFAKFLWGDNVALKLEAHGEILRRPHPVQYRPYQYEGYSAAQRRELNANDIAMRVIRTAAALPADPRWAGYPGPVLLTMKFPSDRFGLADPLVVSGATGAADFLFVRYVDAGHIAVGLDHWGGPPKLSAPVAIDYSVPHAIGVVGGMLLPPEGSPLYEVEPAFGEARQTLAVTVDGSIVLQTGAEFHRAKPDAILFGINLVGGTMASVGFGGEFQSIRPMPANILSRLVNGLGWELDPGPADWGGFQGPVAMTVVLPRDAIGRSQPLVVSGRAGAGDLLYVHFDAADQARFGYDHWGVGGPISGPVKIEPGVRHILVVSMGSAMPPAGSEILASRPRLNRLRDVALVELDGKVVFATKANFHPAGPAEFQVARNPIGASTAEAAFTGQLIDVERVPDPEAIAAGIP